MNNEDLIIKMIEEVKAELKELRNEVKEIKDDVNTLSEKINRLEIQMTDIEAFEKKCIITKSGKLRELLLEAEIDSDALREMVRNHKSKKDLTGKVKEDLIKKIFWVIVVFLAGTFASGLIAFLVKVLK